MKKIFIVLSVFIISLFFVNIDNSFACSWNWDLKSSVDWCFSWSDLIQSWDLKVDGSDFKGKINDWTKRIAFYLWLWAVISIVFSWFTLVTSSWDDEKINKAKDIFKWSIFWFLGIIFASLIILLVINLFYSIK